MANQIITEGSEGAATGYKAGGAWGAVIGAVVGGIAGNFANKAARYRRDATAEEQKAVYLKQAVQRRDLIRSMYIARATQVAQAAAQDTGSSAGLQSSAFQGANASISTQGTFNVKAFDSLVSRQIMQQYYLKKAHQNQGYSDTIMGVVRSLGSAMSIGGSPGGTSSGGGGADTEAQSAGYFTADMGYPSN